MIADEDDEDFIESAQKEIKEIQSKITDLKKTAVVVDPDDKKNAIVEIQSGVGGDESSLFVSDLFTMYEVYAQSLKMRFDVMDFVGGNAGGFKNISFIVQGKNAYAHFKNESGAHRVQRVPKTETKGRVHTSIATVVVLPETQIEDIELNKSDVKVEPYNSGGKGGQHCNRSMNAVKLTHEPTGITASSQLKSFTQNLKLAWKTLATRIADAAQQQSESETAQEKKALRGSGMRNEKIRTYNFPQNRVTDHRINGKYSLTSIISGDIKNIVSDLRSKL
jgi:peptide chain release factor 1